MYGVASALDILDSKEVCRVLNYMPLAHMFGCGTVIAVTYISMVNRDRRVQYFLYPDPISIEHLYPDLVGSGSGTYPMIPNG
jgi:hypothetical protein